MSDGWQRSPLQQRLEEKVRYQYLRYLASHRPETWCFHEVWRNRFRAIRRFRHGVGRLLFRPRLLRILGLAGIAALAAGAVVLVGTFGGNVGEVIALPTDLFLSIPQEGTVVASDDKARIAMTRVAILQILVLLAAIVVAMTRTHSSAFSHRAWFHRSSVVRNQIEVVGWLSAIPFALALIGGVAGARQLPHFWPSVVASVAVGSVLMASVYWGARWLLRFPWLRVDNVTGLLHLLVMILPLLSLSVLWSKSILALYQHLPWLGPVGWLWARVAEVGEGKFASAATLIVALASLAAGVAGVRHRVRSWSYRRKLLEAVTSHEQQGVIHHKISQPDHVAGLAKALRAEISRIPERGADWLAPWWLRDRWQWLVVALGIGLAVQGFAVYVQQLQTALQVASTGGDAGLTRVVLGLSLAPIALVMASIEGVALARLEWSRLERFMRFPLSPWRLWGRLQRFGLLRSPVEIACALPLLVIPATLIENGREMSLLTVGLTLATLVALRTVAVGGAVLAATMVVWPPWVIAVGWAPVVVALGLVGPAVVATLPIEASAALTLSRQAALQVGTLFLMAATSALWHFLLRLPRERAGLARERSSSRLQESWKSTE